MKDEALKLALKDLKWVDNWLCEKPMPECVAKLRKAITTIKEALAQPAQEPVAVHQFRSPHCADWYDGIPDHHDGHGPYEVRTLYTTPPKRPWVGLTDEEIQTIHDTYRKRMGPQEFAQAIEAKLKEKNT